MATQEGRADILKMVLDRGYGVNTRGPGSLTLLLRAVYNRHINAVKLLNEHGADLNLRDTTVSVIIDNLFSSAFLMRECVAVTERRHTSYVGVRERLGRHRQATDGSRCGCEPPQPCKMKTFSPVL